MFQFFLHRLKKLGRFRVLLVINGNHKFRAFLRFMSGTLMAFICAGRRIVMDRFIISSRNLVVIIRLFSNVAIGIGRRRCHGQVARPLHTLQKC